MIKLLVLLSSVISSNLFAAELIQVPSGIVIRSVQGFEETTKLEVESNGISQFPNFDNGIADILVDPSQACEGLVYRTYVEQDAKDFDLGHLCKDSQVPTRFALISDTQEHHSEHLNVAKSLATLIDHEEVDAVILAGDIVQTGVEEEWKSYRDIATGHYSNRYPLVPVIGNHEYFSDPAISYWQKLYGTPETDKGYYAVEYPHAYLITLNSNMYKYSKSWRQNQTAWLEQTLASVSANKLRKPVIVTFHHSPYTSGIANIIMPKEPKYIRDIWVPLFEKYQVSLVMTGHEHLYERLQVRGLCYLVAGPAGGNMGRIKPKWLRPSASKKFLKDMRTISLVEVFDGNISIQTYDAASNDVVDSFAAASCE